VQSDVMFVDVFVDIKRGLIRPPFFFPSSSTKEFVPDVQFFHNGSNKRGNHSDIVIKAPH